MPEPMNLPAWLDYIQALHPVEIDMGLERVREVADRLQLSKPAPLVFTVAGTNGKGSCVALLDGILQGAGYRTGCFTSPHLRCFNERIAFNGEPVSDRLLCQAFERIEAARGHADREISLSYFEFSTLAALLLLQEAELDVAILEVGLGGRLDAVNIVDADLALISSIGLDHQQWLGDTREAIGAEKAGILRAGHPVVCGDPDIPESVGRQARELGSPLYRQGIEFGLRPAGCRQAEGGSSEDWEWWGTSSEGKRIEYGQLPEPALDAVNAATVLQALSLAPVRISEAVVRGCIAGVSLPGRFQRLVEPLHGLPVILDVAHNPQAASNLAAKLRREKEKMDPGGRLHLLLAMMGDKDHAGFCEALESVTDIWYIAAFDQPRCAPADFLHRSLSRSGARTEGPFVSVDRAWTAVSERASPGDLIVVTGSFFTVLDALQSIPQSAGQGHADQNRTRTQ